MGLITLLTDFGTTDYFVGAMKGAILSVNPRATIVDITHEIPAHDIESGAFTLLAAHSAFPAGTIHLAVVDPGVGSARRAIVACTREHFFVGPDNGLFSYVLERARVTRVFHLTNEKYFRASVSPTFHGRDIFAPVAAALSNGVEASELGEQIEDFVRLAPLAPERAPDGTIRARIIHIDRFGNCVTNISREDLPDETIERGARLSVGDHEIHSFRRFFLEGEETTEETTSEAFAVWGSAGFLEIAVRCASAARLLGVERGQSVLLYPNQ